MSARLDAQDVEGALAAYEESRASDGPDGASLAAIAELVLSQAAMSEDASARDAAFAQLQLAGTAAIPVVRRLTDHAPTQHARAQALQILASRGEGVARDTLAGLADSEDVDVRAKATSWLDPVRERSRLLAALEASSPGIRAAAATRLGQGDADEEVRRALRGAARVDPAPEVRSAATSALAPFGDVEALRERLSDPESSVRLAAIGALARADRTEARRALGAFLDGPPGSDAIEAARVLAGGAPDADAGVEGPSEVEARAYLLRALESSDALARVQAANAIASLDDDGGPELGAALAARLAAETEAGVRLELARCLLSSAQAPAARAALEALSTQVDMVGVQAATLLAPSGQAGAITVLVAALSRPDAAERRVAARALARDAMRPDDALPALHDAESSVRIAAAGGILAAWSAR